MAATVTTRHRLIAFTLFVVVVCTAIVTTVVWKTRTPAKPEVLILQVDQEATAKESTNQPVASAPSSRPATLPKSKQELKRAIDCASLSFGSAADPNRSTVWLKDMDDDYFKTINPLIPIYANQKTGQIPEYVTMGPDFWGHPRFFDDKSANKPTNRWFWYTYMNRQDETSSLYEQLGITASDSEADQSVELNESWVKIAINTAKEIRRQMMLYFVFYAEDRLHCPLSPWELIKHEAPDIVQHRMDVFIAKFEFLKPFEMLRRVVYCQTPWKDSDAVRFYFFYIYRIIEWKRQFGHLEEEVKNLHFRGITRVFRHVDPEGAVPIVLQALVHIIKKMKENTENKLPNDKFENVDDWCMLGYQYFDHLPASIQQLLMCIDRHLILNHPDCNFKRSRKFMPDVHVQDSASTESILSSNPELINEGAKTSEPGPSNPAQIIPDGRKNSAESNSAPSLSSNTEFTNEEPEAKAPEPSTKLVPDNSDSVQDSSLSLKYRTRQ